jgi:hypothetical protein
MSIAAAISTTPNGPSTTLRPRGLRMQHAVGMTLLWLLIARIRHDDVAGVRRLLLGLRVEHGAQPGSVGVNVSDRVLDRMRMSGASAEMKRVAEEYVARRRNSSSKALLLL